MIKRIIVLGVMSIALIINAQDIKKVKKIQTKNLRPSVIEVYGSSIDGRDVRYILDKMSMVDLPKRFDNLPIKTKTFFNVSVPTLSTPEKYFQPMVNSYAKKAVATWFKRDYNGDFSDELLKERALNTSTDEDYGEMKVTEMDERMNLAEQLIPNTYLFLYRVSSIETLKEHYRKLRKKPTKILDSEGREIGESKGWVANYSVDVYKLVWGEAEFSKLYQELWSSKDNHKEENVKKWNDAKFQFKLIKSTGGNTIASTTEYYDYKLRKANPPKSNNEMFSEIANDIKESSIDNLTKKIDAFKVKATILSEKPITAKIGTKEGLFVDQRYFAYEIVQKDENSDQKKKRRGVLRVHKVANTDGIAEGHTKASVFTQQGGRRLYNGMLIELNEDIGLIPYVGYTMAMDNKALGGLTLGVDYRVSGLAEMLGMKKVIPGVHIGLGLTFNPYKNLKYGGNKLSGLAMFFEGRISKEFYFTRKGNIYVQPFLGIGVSSYGLSKIDDIKIEKGNKTNISALAIPFGMKIGYNIHPSVSISIVPEAIKTFQYRLISSDGKESTPLKNVEGDKQGFGLDKLEGALNLRGTVVIRIRL